MAYERLSDSKLRGEGLDGFVEQTMKNFSRQMQIRNAEDELNFSRLVLENNLSLEDQLSYRQEQTKRVADDPEEKRRIRAEISSLKNRIEAKKFSDDYTSKLIEFESGMSSVDTLISWLKDRKSATTDDAIRSEIDKQLLTKERERFQLQQTVLNSQTDYALKDKSPDIIEDQISRITSAKNKALLAGNTDVATMYDLQIQSLSRAKTENSIDSAAKNFAVATMAGYMTATNLLDEYSKKISGASQTGAFKIGGVTYNSESEFWRFKRDSYIADDSANGFFGRLSEEQKTQLKTRASQNLLTNDDVAKSASSFTSLAARPELQTYVQKIDAYKQDVIQTGVDLRSRTVQNQYAIDNDVNKAINSLNALKGLGANVEEATTNILTDAAKIKTSQVSNILATTQELMKANPGMTPEEAIDQAIKSGAAATYSPGQLATKSEEEIAKETATAAQAGTFDNDPRSTVTPENAAKTTEVSGPNTPPAVDPVKQGEELSKSGRYFLDSNNKRDVYDSQTNRILSQEEFQRLRLNNALLPARPGPTTTPVPPAPSNSPTPPAPTTPAPVTNPAPKPQQQPSAYSGSSVVDYLKSVGQDASFGTRSRLATEKGIKNYAGTAQQNTELLKLLRGS